MKSPRILFNVLALMFSVVGLAALAGATREQWEALNVAPLLGVAIALFQLACAIVLLCAAWESRWLLGSIACFLLSQLMVGAVCFHIAAGDPLGGIPAVVCGLVAVWGWLWGTNYDDYQEHKARQEYLRAVRESSNKR